MRFGECDGLGHVNNGTYFTYMEDARTEIFELFNPSLELSKWNLIVAGARCDFLAQVKFAEYLTIYTWISKIGKSSFVVEHAIQNDKGVYVARGQATMIGFDYGTQTSVELDSQIRDSLGIHMIGPEGAPNLRA